MYFSWGIKNIVVTSVFNFLFINDIWNSDSKSENALRPLIIKLILLFLAKSTNSTFKLDGNVFKAVIAVVVASVVSAAMGAYVWASIGEMGASAWTIVFPGWAMGDIVASILGLGVLFSLTDEMKRRGLSVY